MKSLTSTQLYLAGILLTALVLRLTYFVGATGSDDMSLANNALRILEDGLFLPTGHYSARLGLTVPLSWIFSLFGTGDWQISLIPLALSLSGIALAFLIAREYAGTRAGLLAAFLLALFPLDIEYASRFYPDLPLGCLLALSVYLALHTRHAAHPFRWALASGLVWGYAYLIKIEAVFLGAFFLYMMWENRPEWRRPALTIVAFKIVVMAENLIYLGISGKFLYRLHIISTSAPMMMNPEQATTQLWIFPKTWFITIYQVGVYYYLLLAAMAWVLFRKQTNLFPLLAWIGIYLLWLQFGGNPFADTYHIKSHLIRYLAMISIPVTVLIGCALGNLNNQKSLLLLVLLIIGTSLFFANYNALTTERQHAAKLGINHVVENDLFPVYMDHTSYAIAQFLLRDHPKLTEVLPLQQHDFKKGVTSVVSPDSTKGYFLLARESMEYAANRYYMKSFDITALQSHFPTVFTASNPLNPSAYLQTRLLIYLSQFLPSQFLREKISATGLSTLEGDDVIILNSTGE